MDLLIVENQERTRKRRWALGGVYRSLTDIVGYGESDKPDATYDKKYFAAWLKQFFVKLKISKAHILGLSQGGAIALQFSIDYPEMVDKLILIDSGALGAKSPPLATIGMVLQNIFPSTLTSRFFSRYILFDPNNRDPNHERYSIEVLKSKGRKNAFTQGRGSAVSTIHKSSLSNIHNKTLVIWGENDQLFPAEYGAKAVAVMPNATLLKIKQAGHLPLMDQPKIFNKVVMDFLNNPETAH
ncbi:alpha/beta fold hydrolase [Microbulbifer halophilus]|uniref:Alpha/beta fold hydrolase n=1 Tax=Microbulbifer halophilus TaxID=453963 RepID=A0ABW5EC10_9GAMM|nr:alpha/beta hydrolase [Microbulbifer halophilus]MCW8126039.1 alpha/beta hydrolase [Microbulbifer halophilus]